MADAPPRYVADFSLALINRTGAYHVCREIVKGLQEAFSQVRYWGFNCVRESSGILRKLLGRLMLADIAHGSPLVRLASLRQTGVPTLYMDPLYVLGRRLRSDDIVLCHDVGPIRHPQLFDADTVLSYRRAYSVIERARPNMVFMSAASRDAFAGVFGDNFRSMTVIRLYVWEGIDAGALVRPDGVPDRFLLSVAATETRKNFPRAIAAYAQSGLFAQGVGYVLCGPRGNSEADVMASVAATPGVVKLGFVSDAELRWLYANACGFVLPSLLEGFGVPALEAGRRGVIPIVSGGALAEAAGPGGLVVDPEDTGSIAGAMVRVAEMSGEERASRVEQLAAHADTLTREVYLARWKSLLNRAAGREHG